MTAVHVVTRVADPATGGNLAMGDVWLDPQAQGGEALSTHHRLAEAIGQPMLALYLRVPVFRLGELLVLDNNDRDQFGRKPSKWDVDVESFDDLDAAIARARQVCSDSSSATQSHKDEGTGE